MPRSLTLFTLFGTPSPRPLHMADRRRICYPVFALAILPDLNPDWSLPQLWLTGALIAVALAASVFVHELTHIVVARRLGVGSTGITLFALGGVAHLDDVTNRPRTELLIAIAGPMVSIAIGLGAFILVTSVDQPTYVMTTEYFYTEDGLRAHAHFYLPEETTPGQAFQYVRYIHTLALANIAIGLFNLLPLFPLDGGRILSATLWAITGNRARAIRIAALIGQLGASAMIAYGAYQFIFGSALSGFWLIALGVFLMEAAVNRRQPIPSPIRRRASWRTTNPANHLSATQPPNRRRLTALPSRCRGRSRRERIQQSPRKHEQSPQQPDQTPPDCAAMARENR